MRISDWSSDVCSSDLRTAQGQQQHRGHTRLRTADPARDPRLVVVAQDPVRPAARRQGGRSEEHTSELQSLMRISYAVFCLKKKKKQKTTPLHNETTTTHHLTNTPNTDRELN